MTEVVSELGMESIGILGSSAHPSDSKAIPMDVATRDFIKSDMKTRFHMDIDTLKLLYLPEDEDTAWNSRVEPINEAFSSDSILCDSLATLVQIETMEQSGEEETEKTEQYMYYPLRDILNRIVEVDQNYSNLEFARQWVIGTPTGPKLEHTHAKDTNNRKAALTLVERTSKNQLPEEYRPFWRQVCITVEVTANRDDGPNGGTVLLPAVIRTLDHMRMNLAFRPFQRWVFGLLICGTDFYVLYLDRAGGFITPTKNIKDDPRLFIEVVLQMSNVMSRSQLGQDPDVEFGVRYDIESNSNIQTYPWDSEFPIYTFPDFSGPGRIETIEGPLFVASGMLGRGTSVWNVKLEGQSTGCIMKYSHRCVKRKNESQIYAGIQRAVPNGVEGICEFMDGGDTAWNEAFQRSDLVDLSRDGVTVINPRRDLLKHPLAAEQDRVVHRLRLNSQGESLVSFKDVQHLTDVLISALKAHRELTSIGILHGDVSAGNILIRKTEDGKGGKGQELTPGLLADMELAKLLPGHDSQLISLLPSPDDAARPGFTCTVHFTSTELLGTIHNRRHQSFTATVEHDLEGFFWVTIWALLIKSQTYKASSNFTQEMKSKWDEASKEREKLITNLFGPHQIREIIQARTAFFSPYLWNSNTLFPPDMPAKYDFDSMRGLWRRMIVIFDVVVLKANYSDITYEAIIHALDPAQIPS